MKKTKKALASLAIAGMVLSMAPMSVFGATTTPTRIAGADRVATAIAVAAQGWTTSDSVIVVSADDANIVDALAAAPLAGQLNAPILVTYKGALDASVQQKIVDLKAKNVYAVGALSADAINSLKAISGVTVTALQGADRTETAAKVAAQLTNIKGSFVVAYNGVADALSAASFAAANGYSIVVANPDGTVPMNEAGYVKAPTYTVGGQVKLDGATALAGADRYATNEAVVKGLTYKNDTVYVANGQSLVDALAGAPLAAKTNSPIVLADSEGIANVVANGAIVALGGVGAVSDAVLGQVGKTNTGAVSVSSVSAISANTFKVAFAAAPADTSKVVFTVQNSGTPITTTVTWNDAKTEASLTYSANFPQGSYSVNVKNDATDLGTSDLTITQQQVAKIQVNSTVLSVDPTTGKGYATYKVFDQYGNDVTNLPMGQNITWTPGIGTWNSAETKNGVVVVDKGDSNIPLTTYTSCVLNAYDSDSYVTSSATLSVSQATGTLSNITLNKLTSPNNDDFNSGNATAQWYVDYTAADASGNATMNFALVDAGILQVNGGPYLNTEVVKDPTDNAKAAISVQLNTANTNTLITDMQVPITVILKNGKTATLNVTLKKAAALDRLTLSAPAKTVASDDNVTIPFTAYDQNGTAITSFSKLDGLATFSNSSGLAVNLVQNPDGTASLKAKMPTIPSGANSLTVYVMATVKATGKTSQLNITVQKPAVATTLSLSSTQLISVMQEGATQSIGFGYDFGGLSVTDQYGRNFDMNNKDGSTYKVVASTTGSAFTLQQFTPSSALASSAAVGSAGTTVSIYGGYSAKIAATTNDALVGTQTVTFYLEDATGKILDTKTQTLTVVKNSDIKGYTLSTPNTLYARMENAVGSATDLDKEYASQLKVYGTTSGGSKVLLAPTFQNTAGATLNTVANASTGSGDFAVTSKSSSYAVGTTSYVYAKKYDLATNPGKTTSTGTVVVMVNGTDNLLHTLTASVTSKNEGRVAASIGYYYDEIQGASQSNDNVTVFATGANGVDGKALTYVNSAYAEEQQPVYFYAVDQYGTQCAPVTVYISSATGAATAATIDANGKLQLGGATTGTITLTGVTTNGLAKSITLTLK